VIIDDVVICMGTPYLVFWTLLI